MRILYVLKHNPWGIGGGCYACRNYLQLFTTMFADDKIENVKGAEAIGMQAIHFENAHQFDSAFRQIIAPQAT